MYLGRPIEHGARAEVFETPLHPYARAPGEQPVDDPRHRSRRVAVKGELPSPLAPPPGCAFHPRCPFANERCRTEVPKLQFYPGSTHLHACHAVEERRLTCRDRLPRRRARCGRACHQGRLRCRCASPEALLGAEGGKSDAQIDRGQAAHSNERVRRGARDRRRASSRGVAAAWRAPAGRAASAPGRPCRGRLTARQIERAPVRRESVRASRSPTLRWAVRARRAHGAARRPGLPPTISKARSARAWRQRAQLCAAGRCGSGGQVDHAAAEGSGRRRRFWRRSCRAPIRTDSAVAVRAARPPTFDLDLLARAEPQALDETVGPDQVHRVPPPATAVTLTRAR